MFTVIHKNIEKFLHSFELYSAINVSEEEGNEDKD